MYGELSRVGDYEGGYEADIIDSRRYDRDRYYDRDYRRSFRTGDTCPYDNEKLMRKKRSVNDTETALVSRLKRQAEGLRYSEYRSMMADRRLYDRYDDRYRSDRYDSRYRSYDDRPYDTYDRDRYRDRYRSDRYDSRYRSYDD